MSSQILICHIIFLIASCVSLIINFQGIYTSSLHEVGEIAFYFFKKFQLSEPWVSRRVVSPKVASTATSFRHVQVFNERLISLTCLNRTRIGIRISLLLMENGKEKPSKSGPHRLTVSHYFGGASGLKVIGTEVE